MFLSVRDLTIDYPSRAGLVRAVDGVSFNLKKGSALGIVGESGSGKSSIGAALMGLTQTSGARVSGQIRMDGIDLATLSPSAWRQLRGDRVSMVFQDAMSTLNPVLRVGDQIAEVFRWHRNDMNRRTRRAATLELLERVGIRDAGRRIDSYPHELSGGMRQRVVIAAAIAMKPSLIIADEPTTALDVTVQAQILTLLQDLIAEQGAAMILISHDLDVVSDVCQSVLVMKDGTIVEQGGIDAVLETPSHSYTQHLLAARPHFGGGFIASEARK